MNNLKAIILLILLAAPCPDARAVEVAVATVEGLIGPVSAKFMIHAIEQAENRGAECVIFELDTPGGLDDSMRLVIKKIMSSSVPVVVFVAPQGSRAASAGAFITMSAHIAAMAPGTAIGAAHPVSIGQNPGAADTNMSEKVTNDAAAYIRSIAAKRGRNIAWADSAVRESVSMSETEAVSNKVVDLIATDTSALLAAIDGREVEIGNGKAILSTRDAQLVRVEMNWRDRFLAVIGHPNIAYVLFMGGLLGLYFELATPGAILPGVVGLISLILAFFSFQALSVNYAGILLIIVAVTLFIIDLKAPTHGVLTVGGIVAMSIGSIMLFDAPDPALRLSMEVLIPVVLVTGAFFAIAVWLSVAAMRRKPVAGRESLAGQDGEARTPINTVGGQVFVLGAHWNAFSDSEIPEGCRIRVVGVRGMTLKVEVLT